VINIIIRIRDTRCYRDALGRARLTEGHDHSVAAACSRDEASAGVVGWCQKVGRSSARVGVVGTSLLVSVWCGNRAGDQHQWSRGGVAPIWARRPSDGRGRVRAVVADSWADKARGPIR
jgi:hypothetical protein